MWYTILNTNRKTTKQTTLTDIIKVSYTDRIEAFWFCGFSRNGGATRFFYILRIKCVV